MVPIDAGRPIARNPVFPMPHSYRRILDEFLQRIRGQYAVSEAEALVILGDVLANLDALVGDLAPREDLGLDPGRSPARILEAIETMAGHLDCQPLLDLAVEAKEACNSASLALPDKAVEPLQRFAQGLRRAAPGLPGGAPG